MNKIWIDRNFIKYDNVTLYVFTIQPSSWPDGSKSKACAYIVPTASLMSFVKKPLKYEVGVTVGDLLNFLDSLSVDTSDLRERLRNFGWWKEVKEWEDGFEGDSH